MADKRLEEDEGPPTPLCVYCGAKWSEPMMTEFHQSQGCPTCGYGAEVTATIEVYCSSCGKLVYKKEVVD